MNNITYHLERLIASASASRIPVNFSRVAELKYTQVITEFSSRQNAARRNQTYLEIANRLFRSNHFFNFETEARYAYFYGKAVAEAKALAQMKEWDDLSQTVYQKPKSLEASNLRSKVFADWKEAIGCETEVQLEGLPFRQRITKKSHQAMFLTPSIQQLQQIPWFLETYYSYPQSSRDLQLTVMFAPR